MTTHAVVIGGSMAGLMNARVLSKHFDRVTVVERDTLPDRPEVRNGVPQGRHLHALLQQGQQTMETMFPGLADDFVEIGAPRFTWGKDAAYLTAGGWIKRFDTGIQTNFISRQALEYLIRRRLTQLSPNVTFVTQTDTLELVVEGDTVKGVKVQSRIDKTVQTFYADLVVDAAGRNSKAVEWLTALGYEAPEETEIKSYIGYATRWYEKPSAPQDWKALFIVGRPTENIKRGGGIFEVEGNQWVVTLGGINKDYPPTDEEGFLEFAKSLVSPMMYEAIKDAKPTSPIYGYRITGNRLRHFDRMKRRPENYLVTGDAVCAFNPQYGQGMTVAGLEAVMLDGLLSKANVRELRGFATKFHKALPKVVNNAWLTATGEDLRYPETEGERPNAAVRMVQRYMDMMFTYMMDDEYVTRKLIQVLNLSAEPTTLFAPRIVFGLLRKRFFSRKAHSAIVSTAAVSARQA
jgi:2-polyprenyl-6-methoxyphenol hydroxylase-like FAD-dependent oxidoreductase